MHTRWSVAVLLAMVVGLSSAAWAGQIIDLKQANGTLTPLGGSGNAANVLSQFGYETVAASQTDQVMGVTGALGDVLASVVCSFSAASVGTVTIKDGGNAAINLFPAVTAAGYQTSGPLNMVSTNGAWQITTGTNTTCIGIGKFSP